MANPVKPPFVGAVVIYHVGDSEKVQNNNSNEMPAVVVRVWSKEPPFCVNLKCLPDGTGTFWRTSVLYQHPFPGAVNAQIAGWRWPYDELVRGEAPMEASE